MKDQPNIQVAIHLESVCLCITDQTWVTQIFSVKL